MKGFAWQSIFSKWKLPDLVFFLLCLVCCVVFSNLLGLWDELVCVVPVFQEVGGLLIVHADVVVLEEARKEVINLPRHIQDVAHPAKTAETGKGRRIRWLILTAASGVHTLQNRSSREFQMMENGEERAFVTACVCVCAAQALKPTHPLFWSSSRFDAFHSDPYEQTQKVKTLICKTSIGR